MAMVLVVESDLSARPAIRELLLPLQQEIIWTFTVEEARAVLEAYTCTMVVANLNCAGKANGLDLWRHCQKKFPDLPFVLLSDALADVFESLVSQGVRCPPTLTKPFTAIDGHNIFFDALGAEVQGEVMVA